MEENFKSKENNMCESPKAGKRLAYRKKKNPKTESRPMQLKRGKKETGNEIGEVYSGQTMPALAGHQVRSYPLHIFQMIILKSQSILRHPSA